MLENSLYHAFHSRASSHFVGKGDSKGERRFLCPGVFRGDTHSLLTGRIQRNQRFRGTRFSVGKSSMLYLCFRLTPGRGWLRHLRLGQMGSGQILFGGSRAGGFCTDTDKIRICSQGKIRLPGKGSRGISTPVPPQRQRPR